MPSECLGDVLPKDDGRIREDEVVAAGKQLKASRACGKDGIPPIFLKAILEPGSVAVEWAVRLLQKCWTDGSVPDQCHEALVVRSSRKAIHGIVKTTVQFLSSLLDTSNIG